MIQQRVCVVFWNETIIVEGVEKRIPLRLPHLLKLKQLDWYGASQTGLVLFNDKRELQINEPDVIAPFLERWQLEPHQPDVARLKRHVDEVTVDPSDASDLTLRRRWLEIEKRHPQPIYPAALLQLMSAESALNESGNSRDGSLVRALLNKKTLSGSSQKRPPLVHATKLADKNLALRKREEERRRLQNITKER
ncbi:MAG: hypothetical protein ACU84Q_03555 [Gammaproteobacteria bacterium]